MCNSFHFTCGLISVTVVPHLKNIYAPCNCGFPRTSKNNNRTRCRALLVQTYFRIISHLKNAGCYVFRSAQRAALRNDFWKNYLHGVEHAHNSRFTDESESPCQSLPPSSCSIHSGKAEVLVDSTSYTLKMQRWQHWISSFYMHNALKKRVNQQQEDATRCQERDVEGRQEEIGPEARGGGSRRRRKKTTSSSLF